MLAAAPAPVDRRLPAELTGLGALVDGLPDVAVVIEHEIPPALAPASVPLVLLRDDVTGAPGGEPGAHHRFEVDDEATGARPFLDPARAGGPALVGAGPLLDHVQAGGRAVVGVGPARLPGLVAALGPGPDLGPLPVRSLAAADPSDPLVFDSRLVASGRGDAFGGRFLAADDFVPVDALGGVALFEVGGSPVAVEIALGAGVLVIVGSTGFATNRWIAAADNAAFVSWALSSEVRPHAAGLARDHRPDPSSVHPAIPAVDAGDDRALLELVPPAGTPIGSRTFLSAAARAGRLLPPAVHDALVDLVDVGNDAGALLVKGLPVGDVPATPSTPVAPSAKDRISELVLLTVARRLGQPVGYQPEHGGDIVQNLLPTRAHADRQTSTSSTVQLEFHTETAFHRHKPRFLLLLCLRGDPNARTLLCSIRAVVDHLPLRVRQILSEPRFRTGVDESFTGERTHRLGRPVAVLEGTMAEPTMTFDADLMVGLDDEADAALEDLRQLIRAHHVGVALETGDLLVVDNAVSVHGRSPFPARFDGTDRWLQRTFVVADLAASAAERSGRVITTRFDD